MWRDHHFMLTRTLKVKKTLTAGIAKLVIATRGLLHLCVPNDAPLAQLELALVQPTMEQHVLKP